MKDQIINRLRNKAFLLSLVSATLLLTQQVGLNIFPSNIVDIINTILVILTIMGVIIDPTTPGMSDKEVK